MMCDCVNVEIGSYANSVYMVYPFNGKWVDIDRCIADEILWLWAQGIRTEASCCGHNKVEPWIGVLPEYANQMRLLGYKEYPYCSVEPPSFYPKSV